jgi:hypothetical protein
MIHMQQKWCSRASLDGQPGAAVPTFLSCEIVIPNVAEGRERNLLFAYATTAA